jgi:hypothetical protein
MLGLLISVAVVSATVLASQPAAKPNHPKRDPVLVRAEAAANQMVQTFHQTLDFAPVFASQFVTEPNLRSRAITIDDPDQLKNFDEPTRERVYVTAMTFLHLWEEYLMIQNANDVPPEFEKMDPKPEWLISSTAKAPQNIEELNQALREAESISALYRKYFSPESFRSTTYRESVRSEYKRAREYRHNVPRIERGNSKFGIPENVPVYVVRPELFDYYFIQEKGTMKLFHVNILPNMRLF